MSSIGLNADGSSSVENRMDRTSGATSPRVNKGDPHSGQKLRVASFPLPARTANVCGVPLKRWQSRQWQLSIATGAAEHT
ncbi:MAG TPA: hypothetical protein VMF03_00025 [Steroidobacteraceae bacterium]|nr:hypothetical protein [Steroidobacteraceae bacterium]